MSKKQNLSKNTRKRLIESLTSSIFSGSCARSARTAPSTN